MSVTDILLLRSKEVSILYDVKLAAQCYPTDLRPVEVRNEELEKVDVQARVEDALVEDVRGA